MKIRVSGVTAMLTTLLLTLSVIASAMTSSDGPNMGIFDLQFVVILEPDTSNSTASTAATTTTKASGSSSTVASTAATTTTKASGSSTTVASTASSSTLSTSTTKSSTSATSTATTAIPSATIVAIGTNITQTLYSSFSGNYGFVTVSPPMYMTTPPPQLVLMYAVVYNKTMLNNAGLLTPDNNTFTDQLVYSAAMLSSSGYSYDGYTINSTMTMMAMLEIIAEAMEVLNSTSWVCSGIECPPTSTCYWNKTMSMATCADKCSLFTEDNTVCTAIQSLPGVYVVGTCAYDQYGQPYCDCGMSVGNVMSNLYDGSQCASSTFIVAMSATAGGVLFLLCIVLIIVINKQREAVMKAQQAATKYKLATTAVNGNGFNNQVLYDNNGYTSDTTTSKSTVYQSEFRPQADPVIVTNGSNDEFARL